VPGKYETTNPNPKIGVEFVIKTLKDNTLMFYIQPLPAGRQAFRVVMYSVS